MPRFFVNQNLNHGLNGLFDFTDFNLVEQLQYCYLQRKVLQVLKNL
jgi:hypothetical protein